MPRSLWLRVHRVMLITSLGLSCLTALATAGCRGRIPSALPQEGEGEGGGEGEGEGEGELPDPDDIRALVDGSGIVAADVGPDGADAFVPADVEGVVAVDLGNVVVEAGVSGDVVVNVDARVHGLVAVVIGDVGAHVIVSRAIAPDGSAVIADDAISDDTPGFSQINGLARGFTGQFMSPGRVMPQARVGAFPVPSSPDVALSPGPWRLRFAHARAVVDDNGDERMVDNDAPLRVVLLLRTAPVRPGRVGLTVHLSGAASLTANTAPNAPSVQRMLEVIGDTFRDVGVTVDDVRFVDVEDGAAVQVLVLDEPRCDGPELDGLSVRGDVDRLNVFIIDHFECGAFGPFLLGFAAGLPQVPLARTPRSSVVVAGSFLADDPELFAVAVAHELGHSLGLFHTQENDRFGADIYDVVADTPNDERAKDNLMFFDAARGSSHPLTRGQGLAMQRFAAVRP